MRALPLASLLLLIACGGDSDPKTAADAAPGLADGAPGGALATTCTGACATTTLRAEFGATTRDFERAFFGLSSPAQSDSGDWEIYLESGAGGDAACPTMDSPTPLFTLITAGLALPSTQSEMMSGTVTLVDFEGALLMDTFFEKASSNTVTFRAADPCVACAEGGEADRSDRMVAIDIDASFAGGSIQGHSYATHCDSLDAL
jgi:hypothetical protein